MALEGRSAGPLDLTFLGGVEPFDFLLLLDCFGLFSLIGVFLEGCEYGVCGVCVWVEHDTVRLLTGFSTSGTV